MDHILRLGIFYLVVTTVGVGWSIVMAFDDLRRKPAPENQSAPAPLWVNILFMLGLTLMLAGNGWAQWIRINVPTDSATLVVFAGMVLLNAGMWGLLFTTARKGNR